MDLAYIDQLSNNSNKWLNRCSVIPKIFLSGTFVVITILADRLIELISISFLLIVLNLFNEIAPKRLFHLALYPVFFSLIFALMRFSYSPEAGFMIMFKAVNAALAMILLITSTPYTQVFSFLRLFLPDLVVEGMFFTYRIFFILIKKLSDVLVILKLRGGVRPSTLFVYLKHLAGAIGLIFINAFDMSERMYSIYSIRGYKGRLCEDQGWLKFNKNDFLPISLSVVIITVVVIF